MTIDDLPAPHHPFWFRHPQLLQRVTVVLIAAAGLSGVVAQVMESGNLAVIWPPLMAVGAVALSAKLPKTAVFGVAVAPLMAVAIQVPPLLTWTIAVLAAFLFTLRGVPARLAAPVIATAVYAATVLDTGQFLQSEPVAALSLALAAAAWGSAIRGQIRYLTAMDQRAKDAIATRDSEVNRRVADERLRIARDLHDVIGHEVAVLSVQLGVVEVALPADATQSRAALVSARVSIQSILLETQRILDLLRMSDGEDLSPAPSISGLPDLVASYRSIGMSISLDSTKLVGQIDPAVGAAVFRIAQESLTNAQRHGTGTAEVLVETVGNSVVLEVRNPIAPAAGGSPGSGYGLVGIRERASSLNGSVEAGSVEAGPVENMFRVKATLPLRKGSR